MKETDTLGLIRSVFSHVKMNYSLSKYSMYCINKNKNNKNTSKNIKKYIYALTIALILSLSLPSALFDSLNYINCLNKASGFGTT